MPQLQGYATESALTYLLCRRICHAFLFVLVVLALQFTLKSV